MNKTDFYKNVIEYFIQDKNEDKYIITDVKNYSMEIGDDINIVIAKVTEDFNRFLKKTGVNYDYQVLDSIMLIENSIVPDKYNSGKLTLQVHYEDFYNQLLDKSIFEAEKEVSVFRIENKNFVGFFNHFSDLDKPLTDSFDFPTNTAPMVDGVLSLHFGNVYYRNKTESLIFGFEDNNSLFKWLNENKGLEDVLRGEELRVNEYKVKEKDLLIGNHQVCFDNKKSRCVAISSINDYLDKNRPAIASQNDDCENDISTILNDKKKKPTIIYKKKRKKLLN